MKFSWMRAIPREGSLFFLPVVLGALPIFAKNDSFSTAMLLSIIIVNYRVPLLLEQCLHSVSKALEELQGEAEVWVVDNASGDHSIAYARQSFPNFHYIENIDNLGFAKANNQAIACSAGKYVLLLNPDTVVGESTLSQVIAAMERNPKIGGLGVRMMNAHGDFLPESKRGFPSPVASFFKLSKLYKLRPQSRLMGRYYMGWLDDRTAAEVEILSGAFMCVRREALGRVGVLDERFFMYGEDIDLSHRIRLGGYCCYYLPIPMLHYKGESSSSTDLKYLHSFYGAMQLFFEKYYRDRMGWFSRATISVAISLHTSLAKLLRLLRLGRGKAKTERRVSHYESFTLDRLAEYKSKRGLDLLIDTSRVSYDDLLSCMQELSGCAHTFHLQRGAAAPIVSPSR